MHYLADDLDLTAFIADGLRLLEEYLMRRLLFDIYYETRCAQG